MSKTFSHKELMKLYRSGSSASSNGSQVSSELISGDTVLKRLQQISYLNSRRAVAPKQSLDSTENTIAICLVIVDELRHESIWREWIEQGSNGPYKAELFIHAKYPDKIRSNWVRMRTLDHSYLPEWNSPEVIRAMLAVLKQAVSNPSCGRFVFGTESCIPIYPLQEAGTILFASDRSWLDAYHMPKDTYEEHYCFRAVDPSIIPPKDVWKALPGWIMLTRRHAVDVLSLPDRARTDDLVVAWNTVHAPEEVYFPTMLALLGYLRDEVPGREQWDEVVRRSVTHAEWKRRGDANPITYDLLSDCLLRRLRNTGAVFARKFTCAGAPVDVWRDLVCTSAPDIVPAQTASLDVRKLDEYSAATEASVIRIEKRDASLLDSNIETTGSFLREDKKMRIR